LFAAASSSGNVEGMESINAPLVRMYGTSECWSMLLDLIRMLSSNSQQQYLGVWLQPVFPGRGDVTWPTVLPLENLEQVTLKSQCVSQQLTTKLQNANDPVELLKLHDQKL
jgi:hypothetical protein